MKVECDMCGEEIRAEVRMDLVAKYTAYGEGLDLAESSHTVEIAICSRPCFVEYCKHVLNAKQTTTTKPQPKTQVKE